MFRSDERGAAYLIMAAFITVLLIIVGALGVDIANKYRLEQMAQDVADHAAMAGAAHLPVEPMAREAAIKIIQGYAGIYYDPETTHIQVTVSADNSAGTVGVIVFGGWNAGMMPTWITGDPDYGISRYAIATMARTWTTDTVPGDLDDAPGGNYALFLGNPACNSVMDGGNNVIIGDAHVNGCANVNGPSNPSDPDFIAGEFEYDPLQPGCVPAYPGAIDLADGDPPPASDKYRAMPAVDTATFHADVTLDEGNAVQTAWYATAKDLILSYGGDGAPGGGDDVVHPDVDAQFTGGAWVLTSPNDIVNGSVAVPNEAADVTAINIGAGLDISVIGALSLGMPGGSGCGGQCYWYGSVMSTKKMTLTGNNVEIRALTETGTLDEDLASYPAAVSGLDNEGFALLGGTKLSGCVDGFDNGGNAFDVYGLVYTPVNLVWSGTMSTYSAVDGMGVLGRYDISNPPTSQANGFVKGSIIAGSITSTGNKLKVFYDASVADDIPITNANTPLRPGSPTVSLIR